MKYFAGLLLSASLLLSAQTEKLIIDSTNFETDDTKGITTFTGNVKFRKAKDKLDADKLDIYMKKNSQGKNLNPTKYIATGNVKFTLFTNGKHYKGKGNKVIYNPATLEYTVIGNGYLKEVIEDRELFGEKIFIYQNSGAAKVEGTEKKPVRFILNVESNNTNTNETKETNNNGDKK